MDSQLACPAVSVIIPVYNTAAYLGKCLESMLCQTVGDIEIICVDDGSTDASLDILRNYARRDQRVRILRHKKNAGLSAARNTGLDAAQAPFIMFCDSDDWYAPTMCEKMLSAIRSGVQLAVCGVQEIMEDGCALRSFDHYFELPACGTAAANDRLISVCNVCVWNKIYSGKIIRENGLLFPVGLHFEDEYFFSVYTLHVHKIAFIEEQLYFYLRRSQSITGLLYDKKATYTADMAHIANRIWVYHEQAGCAEMRLPYLTDRWLSLAANALRLAADQSDYNRIADILTQFATTHILVQKQLGHGARQRIELLKKGCWVGVHRALFGLWRRECSDTSREDCLNICRTAAFCGVRLWKIKRQGATLRVYVFGIRVY